MTAEVNEVDGAAVGTARTSTVAGTRRAPASSDSAGAVSGAAGFAAALADLALAVKRDSRRSEDGGLVVIAEAAAALIPGAEQTSISVTNGSGGLTLTAEYGHLPPLVMAAQNETGQGPCVETVAVGAPVRLTNSATEPRWPNFTPRVAALGVAAMLSAPLIAGQVVFGSLSVLSTVSEVFDEEAVILAGVFAAHAAVALSAVQDSRNLRAMAETRDVIGQAKGILMERHRLTAEQAFAVLVKASQDNNRKLRNLCEEVAQTGTSSDIHP